MSAKKKSVQPDRAPVALITGAGVRLGRSMAWALAESGCDLVLHCRNSRREAESLAKAVRSLGRRAVVLRADLSKAAEVRALALKAEGAFGRVDILINSAGIFWPTPLEKLDARELEAFHATNLRAPYILCSELGRRMKKRGTGVILNMACLSGLRAWRDFLPYSISKAGVVALTVGLAKLLGPEVRVNAIAPGTVLPPNAMSPAKRKALRARLPLKRLGTPEDIVKTMRYLLETPFVTGQVVAVDGGRSVV